MKATELGAIIPHGMKIVGGAGFANRRLAADASYQRPCISTALLSDALRRGLIAAAGDLSQETPPVLDGVRSLTEMHMKKSRFADDQIIGVLREQEGGTKTAEMCCKHGIWQPTFYARKAKIRGPQRVGGQAAEATGG